jgi:hypothetical protein
MSVRKYLTGLGIAAAATTALAACGSADAAPVVSTGDPTIVADVAPVKAPAARKPIAACTGANIQVVVAKVNNPVNHLVITATNRGKVACNAYDAPFLGFENDQSATSIVADSRPAATPTIQPGQSVYAGVTTSATDGSGTHGRTTRTLDIYFSSKGGATGSVGPAAHWTFQHSVFVDDSAKVTYWESSIADALTW